MYSLTFKVSIKSYVSNKTYTILFSWEKHDIVKKIFGLILKKKPVWVIRELKMSIHNTAWFTLPPHPSDKKSALTRPT